MMQSFQTAKNLLFILVYVGWAFVALCAIVGLIAVKETNGFYAIVGAGLISVFGFLIIGVAQMGLAQIATAEYTGQMLEIMRARGGVEHPEVKIAPVRNKTDKSNSLFERQIGSVIKKHKGYVITKASTGVVVDEVEFPNILAAEKWINENPKG